MAGADGASGRRRPAGRPAYWTFGYHDARRAAPGRQQFATEDEAVRLANGVKYGLAASIWTRDHGRAMRMSRRRDFGAVWINTHIPFVSEMPHGGFKHPGYGKDLSMYGFEDYTRIKHVMSYTGT
jgi:betaine-aldehyde dehydrogenase